jgi:hypothetical protein
LSQNTIFQLLLFHLLFLLLLLLLLLLIIIFFRGPHQQRPHPRQFATHRLHALLLLFRRRWPVLGQAPAKLVVGVAAFGALGPEAGLPLGHLLVATQAKLVAEHVQLGVGQRLAQAEQGEGGGQNAILLFSLSFIFLNYYYFTYYLFIFDEPAFFLLPTAFALLLPAFPLGCLALALRIRVFNP